MRRETPVEQASTCRERQRATTFTFKGISAIRRFLFLVAKKTMRS